MEKTDMLHNYACWGSLEANLIKPWHKKNTVWLRTDSSCCDPSRITLDQRSRLKRLGSQLKESFLTHLSFNHTVSLKTYLLVRQVTFFGCFDSYYVSWFLISVIIRSNSFMPTLHISTHTCLYTTIKSSTLSNLYIINFYFLNQVLTESVTP